MPRYRSKKRRTKALIVVFTVMVLIVLHIIRNVNPIIAQVSQKEVLALAEVAVNRACDQVLTEHFVVDMIDYSMDNDGKLQMVTTNTALMNTISRRAVELSQENITSLGQQGVAIPLGSLSGITLLAGQGPDIYVKVFPVGSVNAEFTSEFISAGINQTRHKITLCVTADVRVVMPGMNNVVQTVTDILMCENVIIGIVPDTYFDMNNFSDLLNLVP
ncbi:MAG: sporulation protein YunB [Clostridia bacterium]|nr:sporulation protein YunB [Clostridia bacterium]